MENRIEKQTENGFKWRDPKENKLHNSIKPLIQSLNEELKCKDIVISIIKYSIFTVFIIIYIQFISYRLDSVSVEFSCLTRYHCMVSLVSLLYEGI